MSESSAPQDEWLEADGRGGYASGTASGVRTRRYHALLLAAADRPERRLVLVNGFDAWLDSGSKRYALTSQYYTPGVVSPDGRERIKSFVSEPWPTWTFGTEDHTEVRLELLVPRGRSEVLLRFSLLNGAPTTRLSLRLFLSGRDHHALHKKNPAFGFAPQRIGSALAFRAYPDLPEVLLLSNGDYQQEPLWYENFLYQAERARGLDFVEDLASPGTLSWTLSEDAVLVLRAASSPSERFAPEASATDYVETTWARENERRAGLGSRLARSAEAYVVRRGERTTVIAGYPWFTDWGRDTFIAMRGLCGGAEQLETARSILLAWAGQVSEGMLPNRFVDGGQGPEFNSVDASLWYVIAIHDFLDRALPARLSGLAATERDLYGAAEAILTGYANGTRFGIRADHDGLLAAGVFGTQLTWMDAKVGEWVVTPRIGKPVEVQALWLNALRIASAWSERWRELYARGLASFRARFENRELGCLYDVVDVDHEPGRVDTSFRPNQIFAVGGLPYALLDGERARRIVDLVEARLFTPAGLRSLASGEPGYRAEYTGDQLSRDAAYHQGTVWPWLMGPFVEAWLRVRGFGPAAVGEAERRFLQPLAAQLERAGLGHISEITDAEPPHTPRGCPFQAWSLGELLRVQRLLETSRGRP